MARTKQTQSFVPVDEQGDFYPPATALAAFLHGFTNEPQFDGTLVEVGAYLVEEMLFEVVPVSKVLANGRVIYSHGETIFAYGRELRPINGYTQQYLADATEVQAQVYEMDIYDLRDKLSGIGINATAESIATWSGVQRAKVWVYASAVADGDSDVKMPQELL
jgi:hypothetical protein